MLSMETFQPLTVILRRGIIIGDVHQFIVEATRGRKYIQINIPKLLEQLLSINIGS